MVALGTAVADDNGPTSNCQKQCCGSGSVCFGPPGFEFVRTMYRMDPDPFIFKNSKKNVASYCFVAVLNDFLSLKNDVNVALKSNKQKT
jgi:hypothetical protein